MPSPLLVCLVLLCTWAATTSHCLSSSASSEPLFHVHPPSNWVGAPSAPYRDAATSVVHIYMQYNPTAATAASAAWYHVTSADYVHWSRVTPPTALSVGASYDSNALGSGVLMANNQSTPVAMYTCEGSDGVQRQCMAGVSTNAAGTLNFSTMVKSATNPIIAPADVPGLVSSAYFRDPTEWWADPATRSRWLVAFAGRVADSRGTRAHVVAFATTDPSFQSGYRYSHSLYMDNFTGGTATFEHPDFFTATIGGERYLKLSLQEVQQDVVLYGTYVANASSGQYVFNGSTTRRPTFMDYGCFYGAKTFYDAVLRTRRVWGWIREELTAAQISANGWSGVQALRGVVYDTTERRLRFPPISELQSLRTTQLASQRLLTVTEAAPLTIYAGSSTTPKYQEIIATFYVPSTFFDGTRYFAAEPPEFGLRVRMSPDAAHYIAVSVQMPATNATPTRGYRQPGKRLWQLAVGEDSVGAVSRCRTACTSLSACVAWNVYVNVSGFTCELLSTAAPLEVDCSAQTGRPNVPLLVVNRTTSTTAGSVETLSGRAPLTNAHAGYVKLHIFIDDSVVEVFKDDGMEVISSRVYLGDEGNFTGVSLFVRNLQERTSMLADVTAYGMSSIWTAST